MSGGIFDKVGNWFEQGSVVLQWLRILLDHATAVTWEARGPEGDGIDYWLLEGGERIAVQCKTRSTGKSWTASELAKPLRYARQQLDDRASHYRFVTDHRPADLNRAVIAARAIDSPPQWLADDTDSRARLIEAMGFDPLQSEQLSQAHALMRRISIIVTCQDDIDERIRELAAALVGDESDRLRARLGDLARHQALGKKWTATALRTALEPDRFSWRGIAFDGTASAWLDRLTSEFLDAIRSSRRGRERYPREEVSRLLAACDFGRAGGVVLVHGMGGSGKSEVVAQSIEELKRIGLPVLALRADAVQDPNLGSDPLRRLQGIAGDGPACLVIDQLDQAAASSTAPGEIKILEGWVTAAVQSGFAVLVGCRSVDAEQDTQLHRVINSLGRPAKTVAMEDLTESIVASQLTPLGVPLEDLGSDLKRLARNPLILALLVDLIRQDGSWRGADSTFWVIDQWWARQVTTIGQQADAVLDAVVDAMERDGLIAVEISHLPHRQIVDALISMGTLVAEAKRRRVRLVHQLIADARMALRWSSADTAQELLDILGPRDRQGLREARRLRLSIPRFAARGSRGADILRDVAFQPQVRPLMTRAILMGLADVEGATPELRDLVIQWLADPLRRDTVLAGVVRGRVEWMDALDGWLDEAWTSWTATDRDRLLDLCAAVSTRRGDTVARHLAEWEQRSPGTIAKAQWVFWHDSSEDSEALFQLRLDFLVSAADRHRTTEWPKLLEGNPRRAIALLFTLLKRVPEDALWNRDAPDWMYRWPTAEALPESFLDLGRKVWDQARAWWTSLTTKDLWRVRTNVANQGHGLLVDIAECLARSLAVAMRQGLDWSAFVAELPSPLRDIDGWILLLIGRHLDYRQTPAPVFSAAADWFMSDPKWAHLHVGMQIGTDRFALAKEFVRNVAVGLTEDQLDSLSEWIAKYPDSWTILDEEERIAFEKHSGTFLPNRRGETAYILLPSIDPSHWCALARSTYDLLKRKFDPHADYILRSPAPVGGLIQPKLPDEVADRQSDAEWIALLHKAPVQDLRWRQKTPDTIGEHTLSTVLAQLRHLAARNPKRYIRLGHAIARSIPPPPPETFSAIVGSITRTTPPDNLPPGFVWQQADDAQVAALIEAPAFLDNPVCARDIADAVERRPEFPWPASVLRRLQAIAAEDGPPYVPGKWHDLISYRINDAACTAMSALAEIAKRRAEFQPDLLEFAEKMSSHPNLGRRATAGTLAIYCLDTDLAMAARIVLDVSKDPLIAAERDIHHGLLHLVGKTALPKKCRDQAKTILLGLVPHDQEHLADIGGISAICLRAWDYLEQAELTAALAGHPLARRSVAGQVAQWLGDRNAPPWLRPYAVELANDADETVGDAILRAFNGKASDHLLEDRTFTSGLLESAAARRDPERLLDACDRRGTLIAVSDHVLELAQQVASSASTGTYDWKVAHHAQQVSGLIARLIEEANRRGGRDLAMRALDALDRLVESGLFQAQQLLRMLTDT